MSSTTASTTSLSLIPYASICLSGSVHTLIVTWQAHLNLKASDHEVEVARSCTWIWINFIVIFLGNPSQIWQNSTATQCSTAVYRITKY